MVEENRKEKCCGCGACVAICPINVVVMKEDEKGFVYPSVDIDGCIDCGQCQRVCPCD